VTWVIGASSIFGYGTIISDVRVTFADGSERDLVQKAYGLGPFIIGGFAGSVKIGFRLLESLRHALTPPDAKEPGTVWAWEPLAVAEVWQPMAAEIFANSETSEQKCLSHILLVGISNEIDPETAHIPNVVQGPRAFIIKMMSPHFEPIVTNRRLSVEHIGSGGYIPRYTELIRSYFDIGSNTLQAETGAIGMWPKMLARGVMRVVNENPVKGISPHVHILVCRNGEMFTMTNDAKTYRQGDPEIQEFSMPAVAHSYEGFLTMCGKSGLAAEGAIA
jgi:hypothetical protein